jgi:hypothetical protein
VVLPASDPGRFNLEIDGVTAGTGADVGNGGTTGPIVLATGSHSVGETAGTGTSLADYTSSISCSNGAAAANAGPLQVEVTSNTAVTCTVTNTRQTGTLTVNKVVSPGSDSGLFNLQIDGSTAGTGANVGNGGSTGAIPVVTGAHTVGETAGTGTMLADYSSNISCSDGTVLMGSGGPLQVNVPNSINVVCTITNTRRTGTLTVNKVVSPGSDLGLFNLQIDGNTAGSGANVGHGGSTGAIPVNAGIHAVGELGGTNTSLADYISSIDCGGGVAIAGPGPLLVPVSDGGNVVCTIVNIRRTGTLTVNKVVSPAADPGLFNLQIDGNTAGSGANVGNGGTTGTITVNTGAHSVGEIAGTGTSLADYTSSISCTGGAAAANAGPLQVNVTDSLNVVCTITNTRISECPPTTRIAHSRGNPCTREDPEDPTVDPTVDPTMDTPSVPGPAAPTVDPEVAGAGDTKPLQPVDQVLGSNTEQPAPADPGLLGGFLPRTGAGIAGQAMLALLLMAAGLSLRLARRRRSPQA